MKEPMTGRDLVLFVASLSDGLIAKVRKVAGFGHDGNGSCIVVGSTTDQAMSEMMAHVNSVPPFEIRGHRDGLHPNDTDSLNMRLKILVNDYADEKSGAHCDYSIMAANGDDRCPQLPQRIQFQRGPLKEAGRVNGISTASLIAILIHHLEGFMNGQFPSNATGEAIDHLSAAGAILAARAYDRFERGVLGEHKA